MRTQGCFALIGEEENEGLPHHPQRPWHEALFLLFAAGFDSRNGGQIGREVVRLEGFDVHLHERDEGAAEVGEGSAAAVHDGSGGLDDAAVVADDLDGFLHAAAAGDDVLGDKKFFAGGDGEAAHD